MTTATRELSPPAFRHGLLARIRALLFRNWSDALMTLASVTFIVLLLQPVLRWIFSEATRWEVLSANLAILLRGRYDVEAAWRIWVCLGLVALVTGMALGIWSGKFTVGFGMLLGLPLAMILIPIFDTQIRLGLVAMSALIGLGFVMGTYGPQAYMGNIAVTLLVLILPVSLVLLYGFGQAGPMRITPPKVWGGLLLSVVLALTGIVFSYPLGIVLALGRRSKLPVVKMLSVIYIEFVRGVPLIALLFMAVVMLELFVPDRFPTIEGIVRVAVAITLFSAAYMAENVRAGLATVPAGQVEATWALGLNSVQTMVFVVLPQALKAIIPVTVNQFISLFKDTTLVALVGMLDLVGMGRAVLGNPTWLGTHKEIYFFIGVLFWFLNYGMSYGSRRLEQRLHTGIESRA